MNLPEQEYDRRPSLAALRQRAARAWDAGDRETLARCSEAVDRAQLALWTRAPGDRDESAFPAAPPRLLGEILPSPEKPPQNPLQYPENI